MATLWGREVWGQESKETEQNWELGQRKHSECMIHRDVWIHLSFEEIVLQKKSWALTDKAFDCVSWSYFHRGGKFWRLYRPSSYMAQSLLKGVPPRADWLAQDSDLNEGYTFIWLSYWILGIACTSLE